MKHVITNTGLAAIIRASGPVVRVWLACVQIADRSTMQVKPFQDGTDLEGLTGLSRKTISNAMTRLCDGDEPRLFRLRRGVYALNPNLIVPNDLSDIDLQMITGEINRALARN